MSFNITRGIGALCLAFALGASLLTSTATADQQTALSSKAQGATLFVQDAASATAERQRGKRWKVTLTGVNPTTVWFQDRPGRDAGRESTLSFVRNWTNYGFAAVPPNAVLQHSNAEGVVVELRNPRYNSARATLTYTAIIDPGSKQRLDSRMKNVSLFIDNAQTSLSSATFELTGITANMNIVIGLTEPDGESDPVYAAFILGDPTQNQPVLELTSPDASVAIETFTVYPTEIVLNTSADMSGGGTGTLQITLPISTAPTVTDIGLSLDADPGVNVLASINGGQAQSLSIGNNVFPLNP
jgi:hypothetical protein